MPRRISDYPDAYAGWNLISSYGSIISVIATGLFLQLLYKQLVKGLGVVRNLWYIPKLFYDLLRLGILRENPSLEWCLQSPPKPHAFVSLPLQSGKEEDIIDLLIKNIEKFLEANADRAVDYVGDFLSNHLQESIWSVTGAAAAIAGPIAVYVGFIADPDPTPAYLTDPSLSPDLRDLLTRIYEILRTADGLVRGIDAVVGGVSAHDAVVAAVREYIGTHNTAAQADIAVDIIGPESIVGGSIVRGVAENSSDALEITIGGLRDYFIATSR